jgi:hypothetical protein
VIVTVVVAAGVTVFVGSFVWDRLRRRKHRALATQGNVGAGRTDVVESALADESILRTPGR